MTALLSCDGCGQIVSDRPDDEDPTGSWWCLSPAPMIGGSALLPLLSLSLEGPDDLDEDADLPMLDPPRHFCGISCLYHWSERKMAE